MSRDDAKAISIYQNSVKKAGNNYFVSLPFKSDNVIMRDNFDAAKRRILNFSQSLFKSMEKLDAYVNFMQLQRLTLFKIWALIFSSSFMLLYERKRAIKNQRPGLSAFCEHSITKDHIISWTEAKILKLETDYRKLLSFQSWHINAKPHVMNRNMGSLFRFT